MFDRHTYVANVTHSNTNVTKNFSFQQVSGSLIKTHADSIFVRVDKGSDLEKQIFNPQPKMKVRVGWIDSLDKWGFKEKHPHEKEREVTVLQVLLAHDSSYLCEVVVHYQKGDEQFTEEKE